MCAGSWLVAPTLKRMKDLRPWWAQWRDVYFQLMTLACGIDMLDAPSHLRVYTDGDHSFMDSDIKGEFECVEEQLWAFRNGLTDIAFTLCVSAPRYRRSRTAKR